MMNSKTIIKKKNHVTPKCLIKQWEVEGEKYRGVFVYENEKKEIKFSCGEGQKPFSFAIEKYIYVPEVDGKRIDSLENWFADVEGNLAFFIEQLRNSIEGLPLLRDKGAFHKFLIAIFSLKNRSKYDLECVSKYLEKNPELKSQLEVQINSDVHLVVLENLINCTTDEAIEYRNSFITVFKNSSGNLILSDRPFLFDVFEGLSFLVLSPYLFITIKKSEKSEYTVVEADEKFIDFLNKKIAENSRYWIVGNNKDTIKGYIPSCPIHVEYDAPDFKQPKFLQSGYTIRP